MELGVTFTSPLFPLFVIFLLETVFGDQPGVSRLTFANSNEVSHSHHLTHRRLQNKTNSSENKQLKLFRQAIKFDDTRRSSITRQPVKERVRFRRILKSGDQFASSHDRFLSESSILPRQSWTKKKDDMESRAEQVTYTSKFNGHKKRHRHLVNQKESNLSKNKPNIIFILTDDQDLELGSMNYMPKTRKIFASGGVEAKNAYVTTPMCCPSRSSILTGLYVHNHNVYTNGENCSSSYWQQTYERLTFATYLRNIGYRTAFFGKYLNEYNGSYIPPGWSDWSALIKNSRYYNYTLNVNGDKVRHGFDYQLDYYPDLILNDSLQYLRYSKRFFSSKPYLIVLSFPSPHGPEDAAPQFQNMFLKEKLHRTPSWNFAPNRDKQWLLRNTAHMSPIQQEFTDFLNAKRLQTLQSVDNAIFQIYNELKDLGELDNTYMIYTSDHGYHLGQFGLVKGKAMPFEFDIHVPFYIRGPHIPYGRTLPQIILNIDIAPTILDMAGLKVPSHMDGISFLPYLKQLNQSQPSAQFTQTRSSFLVERGTFIKFKQQNSVDRLLYPIIGKRRWLQMECQKVEYQSPCKMFQKFECFQDESGLYRLRKCKPRQIRSKKNLQNHCICSSRTNQTKFENGGLKQFTAHRKQKKRKHKKNWSIRHNYSNDRRVRHRRDALFGIHVDDEAHFPLDFDINGVYELKKLIDIAKAPLSFSHSNLNAKIARTNLSEVSNITTSQLVSILHNAEEKFVELANYTDYLNRTFCTVTRSNLSIVCSEEIYQNQEAWREKKDFLDSAIQQLQQRLFELKGIRRFINEKKPGKSNDEISESCQCRGDEGDLETSDRLSHPRRQAGSHMEKRFNFKKWLRRHDRKMKRKEKFENTTCETAVSEQMNCFTHDNHHWKTPPLWTNGPFCFCQNALNNSFWCMRTINATHNFLYCEFVTGFLSYYDLLKDPFQLRNTIYDLEFSIIEEMSRDLAQLKSCSGSTHCTLHHSTRHERHHPTTRTKPFTSHRRRHWPLLEHSNYQNATMLRFFENYNMYSKQS